MMPPGQPQGQVIGTGPPPSAPPETACSSSSVSALMNSIDFVCSAFDIVRLLLVAHQVVN
jgi:hypothetical protein